MTKTRKQKRKETKISIIITALICLFIALTAMIIHNYNMRNYRYTNYDIIGEAVAAECIGYDESRNVSKFLITTTGEVIEIEGKYIPGVVILTGNNNVVWYTYNDAEDYFNNREYYDNMIKSLG